MVDAALTGRAVTVATFGRLMRLNRATGWAVCVYGVQVFIRLTPVLEREAVTQAQQVERRAVR